MIWYWLSVILLSLFLFCLLFELFYEEFVHLHIFSIQKSIISLQNKPVKSRNLLDHNQAFWAAFTAKKARSRCQSLANQRIIRPSKY